MVATNGFRAGGGGDFPGLGPERIVLSSDEPHRVAIRNLIERSGPIDRVTAMPWRFSSIPQTAAQFETGPGARVYPELITGKEIELLGSAPGGFDRYTLNF